MSARAGDGDQEREYLVLPEQRALFSPDVYDRETVTVVEGLPAFPSHDHVEFAMASPHLGIVVGVE